jgi:hypothetical protein
MGEDTRGYLGINNPEDSSSGFFSWARLKTTGEDGKI